MRTTSNLKNVARPYVIANENYDNSSNILDVKKECSIKHGCLIQTSIYKKAMVVLKTPVVTMTDQGFIMQEGNFWVAFNDLSDKVIK